MTPDIEQRIDPSTLTWIIATKTRPMLVKHMSAVCADMDVKPALLLRTLEGDQTLREHVFVCMGDSGEMWQQAAARVFQKYSIDSCDSHGWFTATPKPDKTVEACQIKAAAHFHVLARWGTLADDGTYYQSGRDGDWIVRSPEDPGDVWIVRGSIFAATYEVRP